MESYTYFFVILLHNFVDIWDFFLLFNQGETHTQSDRERDKGWGGGEIVFVCEKSKPYLIHL